MSFILVVSIVVELSKIGSCVFDTSMKVNATIYELCSRFTDKKFKILQIPGPWGIPKNIVAMSCVTLKQTNKHSDAIRLYIV